MALEISFRNSILLQAGNGILRIGKITYYENSKWSFFANGINGSGEIRLLYCILIRNWQMQNRRECDFVMTRRGLIGIIILSNILKGRKALKYLPIRNI